MADVDPRLAAVVLVVALAVLVLAPSGLGLAVSFDPPSVGNATAAGTRDYAGDWVLAWLPVIIAGAILAVLVARFRG